MLAHGYTQGHAVRHTLRVGGLRPTRYKKENGGKEVMMNGKTRTLAFQIDETK